MSYQDVCRLVNTHLWGLYSAVPLGDQATCIMAWYPTQSHYLDTEPTSPCHILARKQRLLHKSLVWLDRGPNSWSPGREDSATAPSIYILSHYISDIYHIYHIYIIYSYIQQCLPWPTKGQQWNSVRTTYKNKKHYKTSNGGVLTVLSYEYIQWLY